MECMEMPGGVLLVELKSGDLKSPEKVNGFFERLLREDERKRVLVDIESVRDATSLMMGTLLSLHLLAYENLAVLKFTGLSPKVKMLFSLLGVDHVIQAHYGREEALRAFDQVGAPPGYEDAGT
ncbi:MAG: anti-sigma factor antagonist [Planctomycetes bacterium]|nr:anti-sigma factor antagonist [Planctomycetota bacterium]